LSEETYSSVSVYQLVQSIIDEAEGRSSLLIPFIIVDVNERSLFDKEHVIGAYHYNRALLARNHFETSFLIDAKREGKKVIIYGDGGDKVTPTLYQRGFDAILLRGNTTAFKSVFPIGFVSSSLHSFDVPSLRNVLEELRRKRGAKGKLLHSTMSTRSRSVDRIERSKERGRAISAKRPWIPPGSTA
ncbi:hypothetical protein PRIPAC_81968, partial [Pristionchus pacificus]|uniref:Rhodanese domain-containing protein n=1 Tax=Pristionchus pacificus TaxID=54126 RepID=A0A8R1Z8X7_PRIPA